MALPPDVEAAYTKIIDSILAESDLNTISEKRIRKGLQAAVDHDITPQKNEIKQLILARFDKASERAFAADATVDGSGAQSNGHATATTEAHRSSDEPSSPPPSKHKREHDSVEYPEESAPPAKKKKQDLIDEDAVFAAKLQAEENSRARPTRAGATRRKPVVNKKKSSTKKKSSNKVASDGSDAGSGSDDEGKDEKKVNRTGGFHKPLLLSPALSELVGGETSMSRPQIVKNVWAHIKEHGLQDPNDKRQICCDDAMRAVFKQDRVHMFTMNKIINQNVYAMDE
ncbi:SWIB-domain-containing protein [Xylona heveae TC161]|uniref:SWIB-domain-containing protein n=1 Tax=Xylona heveae (strain CBS 132557 / TC161) TaxID=1328760 RepID=A0A165JZX7_XYLHT|nr:SWIB-domain-containing protein [Xylona heveae TC161]KZF26833.1 SWIB-domain-containing protein [Xylona heveae TC161]